MKKKEISSRDLGKVLGVSHQTAAKIKRHAEETRPRSDAAFGVEDPLRKSAALERFQRARLLKHRADREEGNSIPREAAQALASDLLLILREEMLNLPSQRGDQMAAELGVDGGLLKQVLRRHIGAHMTDAKNTLQGAA